MKTRSQRLAAAIYAQVKDVKSRDEKVKNQYGALCHRFPIMVLRSGLAQTVGFLCAKAKGDFAASAHGLLLAHLAEQLGGNVAPAKFQSDVNKAPLAEYRHLTRSALSAAVWYKRYAESVLGVDATAEEKSS
jgi:CRISPR-associated protein Cmr5